MHDSVYGRGNPDECRIQVPNTDKFDEAESSASPVFFRGYYSTAPDANYLNNEYDIRDMALHIS